MNKQSDPVLAALRRLSVSADAQVVLRWKDESLNVTLVDYGDGAKRVSGLKLTPHDLATAKHGDTLLAEALITVQRRMASQQVFSHGQT